MNILFKNKHEQTMELNERLTIEELIKMGVTSIRLFDKKEAKELQEGWWINVENFKSK
jgi:hypothetical protein